MFFYVYQIKNMVNDKVYVGVHKTNNINDGYMGSGAVLKHAIKKYGIENFIKTIIKFCPTYEDALQKESEIVTDEFLLREDVYNIRRGGTGGFDYINKNNLGYLANNPPIGELNNFYGKHHTPETKQKLAQSTKRHKAGVPLTPTHRENIAKSLIGKKHSEERRKRISQSRKGQPAHNKNQPAPRWKCPHCFREGGGLGNKTRFHFDNCKNKGSVS